MAAPVVRLGSGGTEVVSAYSLAGYWLGTVSFAAEGIYLLLSLFCMRHQDRRDRPGITFMAANPASRLAEAGLLRASPLTRLRERKTAARRNSLRLCEDGRTGPAHGLPEPLIPSNPTHVPHPIVILPASSPSNCRGFTLPLPEAPQAFPLFFLRSAPHGSISQRLYPYSPGAILLYFFSRPVSRLNRPQA